MDRIGKSKQKKEQLFGPGRGVEDTDPEFQQILDRFVFGDVFHYGSLDDQTRELITLAVLTVNGTLPQLRAHTGAALSAGADPAGIREAVYQCAPYIGFPKTLNALGEMNAAFRERGVALPAAPQGTVDEDTRFERGLDVQTQIFGNVIRENHAAAPENQKHIQEYLSAFCFGDFYTRGGLDLKTRELLTLCIVSALGGCENQVRAHVRGNANIGNGKEILISAITHCLPYMGFPRTLNTLSCINEVLPEAE
ncbi:carboxymuconolactone decarboxylase family protein [Christensenella tenuis]|uniref:Carboxymuconolactone decarboxylase family protein n=1 Tax=Christensenella tenuis TaxID=2763033 RepID=A0ABR7EF26_9FIRM|nr:carboxymuconolactone decarboxylase family protein [Christensenella tenuis]MBC5648360.1 carboxymuconolactone decarboxylase family protein [Christensenella tenuis]